MNRIPPGPGLESLLRVLFSALFLFLIPRYAFPADAEDVVSRLQENYEGISSISADFAQETVYVSLRQRSAAQGKVYFKKPGRMRWKYSSPSKSEIVSNGIKIWVYEPDISQVIETTVAQGPPLAAMNFLFGAGDLKKDFKAGNLEEKRDSYSIDLFPRVKETNLKKLVAEVDKTRFLIVKTVVTDTQGVETTVIFKDIKVNPEPGDSFFEFRIPVGVRLVRP